MVQSEPANEDQMERTRDWRRVAIIAAIGLFAAFVVFSFARALATQGDRAEEKLAEECASDYQYLLQVESFGHAARDSHPWADFSADCVSQVDELNSYYAARAAVRSAGNVCTGQAEVFLTMLETYGECDGTPLAEGYEVTPPSDTGSSSKAVSEQSDWPGGEALSWAEAGAHTGTVHRVCGPLVSVRSDDEGTCLNIGHDYPDSRRFTVIFWDVAGIDPVPPGATICTSGDIVDYSGVAQIHTRPEDIQIWQ